MRFIFIAACLSNLHRAYASSLTATTADAVFGCEQFNSTGGTRTRVGTSFTGAHDPNMGNPKLFIRWRAKPLGQSGATQR